MVQTNHDEKDDEGYGLEEDPSRKSITGDYNKYNMSELAKELRRGRNLVVRNHHRTKESLIKLLKKDDLNRARTEELNQTAASPPLSPVVKHRSSQEDVIIFPLLFSPRAVPTNIPSSSSASSSPALLPIAPTSSPASIAHPKKPLALAPTKGSVPSALSNSSSIVVSPYTTKSTTNLKPVTPSVNKVDYSIYKKDELLWELRKARHIKVSSMQTIKQKLIRLLEEDDLRIARAAAIGANNGNHNQLRDTFSEAEVVDESDNLIGEEDDIEVEDNSNFTNTDPNAKYDDEGDSEIDEFGHSILADDSEDGSKERFNCKNWKAAAFAYYNQFKLCELRYEVEHVRNLRMTKKLSRSKSGLIRNLIDGDITKGVQPSLATANANNTIYATWTNAELLNELTVRKIKVKGENQTKSIMTFLLVKDDTRKASQKDSESEESESDSDSVVLYKKDASKEIVNGDEEEDEEGYESVDQARDEIDTKKKPIEDSSGHLYNYNQHSISTLINELRHVRHIPLNKPLMVKRKLVSLLEADDKKRGFPGGIAHCVYDEREDNELQDRLQLIMKEKIELESRINAISQEEKEIRKRLHSIAKMKAATNSQPTKEEAGDEDNSENNFQHPSKKQRTFA